MGDTIFGKILRGEIPAQRVWEDEQCIAILDINPQAPLHVLIIPHDPIKTVDDAPAEKAPLLGHLTWVAAEIARREGVSESGYRLVWNCKGNGGQEVNHIHLHLLAGRPMKWPPG